MDDNNLHFNSNSNNLWAIPIISEKGEECFQTSRKPRRKPSKHQANEPCGYPQSSSLGMEELCNRILWESTHYDDSVNLATCRCMMTP